MKTKRTTLIFFLVAACAALALNSVWAAPGGAPQASIYLQGGNAGLCNFNNTEWTLDKAVTSPAVSPVPAGTEVTWTVTVTRGDTSDNFISVNGFMGVINKGTAPATIGNIVVNLQKQVKIKSTTNWVSVAADAADATHGDLFSYFNQTTPVIIGANLVAAASQENQSLNQSIGAKNYKTTKVATSNGTFTAGTFIETPGSGPLVFMDANNNAQLFNISPPVTIDPGDSINLLFIAKFDNSILGLAEGQPVRAEVMVSFDNAGPRAGSGASAYGIDIDDDSGTVKDVNDGWVRSVPVRFSLPIPPLVACNSSVTLTDTGDDVIASGGASISGFSTTVGEGSGSEVLSDSATRTVNVTVGGSAGEVCNTAFLDGPDNDSCSGCQVQVQVGTDNLGNPIFFTFPCCTPTHLHKQSCVTVTGVPPTGIVPGDFCTFTQGGWGSKCPTPHPADQPGCILADHFADIYPSGVVIGIPSDGTGQYWLKFTSAAAIQNYLPATATPGVLTANLTNPVSTSAGVFGGQVLTLQLNVDFNNAGFHLGASGPVGNQVYCNAGDSLSGKTVSEILAAANFALGGGTPLPDGYTISSLNDLVSNLNEAFDNCTPTDWAQAHLAAGGCP